MESIAQLAARYRLVAAQRIIGDTSIPVTFYIHAGNQTYTMALPQKMTTPTGKEVATEVVRRIVQRVQATAVVVVSEVWVVTAKPGEIDRYAGRSLADVEGREERLLVMVETPTDSRAEMCGIVRDPKSNLVTDILPEPEDQAITGLQGRMSGYFEGPRMRGGAALEAAIDVLASDTISRPAPAPAAVRH